MTEISGRLVEKRAVKLPKSGDEFVDLICAYVFWAAFDPVYAGFFGAINVTLGAKGFADLIEQFPGCRLIRLSFFGGLQG
jgi:hypothetical protein